MEKVSEVLSQKLSAIQLLQDQIIAYQLSTQDDWTIQQNQTYSWNMRWLAWYSRKLKASPSPIHGCG